MEIQVHKLFLFQAVNMFTSGHCGTSLNLSYKELQF